MPRGGASSRAGTSRTTATARPPREMHRSELVASAVALRELGYDVSQSRQGRSSSTSRHDAPGGGEGRARRRDRRRGRHAGDDPGRAPRARSDERKPGDPVTLTVRREARRRRAVTVRRRFRARRPDPADRRHQRRPGGGHRASRSTSTSTSGSVGGPSAGLRSRSRSRTCSAGTSRSGCRIAATGELALDGTVLSVGGLQQKTIGARKADVDVFVVPAGENAAEAQQACGRSRGRCLWRVFNKRCSSWQRRPKKC